MSTEQVQYVFDVVTNNAVKELDSLSRGFSSLSAGFKQLSNLGGSFSKALSVSTKSVSTLTKAIEALSGVALGKTFADATKEAIDFYETLNLFQVAMKDSVEQGQEFINTISEWYGLDPKNLMQYTGTFYEMAYAVEAPAKAAQQLSTSLTALSVDLASLFNVDVEKVTDNLTSGIRGMSRAVVKYGLDVRASTVEAYANSIGIKQQYETMNEASREILRYLVMVKQARDATGDFGKTIEQPANQLRVFKEQISQIGRAIGTFLVQPLQQALPVINGVTMAIKVMLQTLAAIMGYQLEVDQRNNLESVNDTVTGIGASADKTKKKLKNLIAPFDELTVLQDNASSSSGAGGFEYGEVDPILLQALDDAQYALEEVRMKAMDTRDAVLAFFGFTPSEGSWVYSADIFEKNLINKFPKWQETIAALFDFDYSAFLSNVKLLFGSFKMIASDAIGIVMQDLSDLLGIDFSDSTIAGWIDSINQKFFEFRKYIIENSDTIAQFAARLIELYAAFNIVRAVAGILAPIFAVLSGTMTVIGTIVAPIATGFSTLLGIFSALSGIAQVVSANLTAISAAIGATSQGLAAAGASGTSFVGVIQTLLNLLASTSGILVTVGAAMSAIFVGGFIKWMATSDTFREYLSSWGDSIGSIFNSLKDIFTVVWDTIMTSIDNVSVKFSSAFESMSAVVQNLLDALDGVLDFIAGVFTGDWKRALSGIYNAWYNIWAAVLNTIGSVLNVAISAINNFVQNMVNKLFGVINSMLSHVPDTIKATLGISGTITAPTFDLIKPLKVVVPPALALANGGVVTGPTRALIGEAGKAEMVMPLDNSPQMTQFISQIADAVRGNNAQPVEVHVYLDSKAIASGMYDELRDVEFRRGSSLIR